MSHENYRCSNVIAFQQRGPKNANSTSTPSSATFDTLMESLYFHALCPQQILTAHLKSAGFDPDLLDIPGFRSFVIDIINYLIEDQSVLVEHLRDRKAQLQQEQSEFLPESIDTDPEDLYAAFCHDLLHNQLDLPISDPALEYATAFSWITLPGNSKGPRLPAQELLAILIVSQYNFAEEILQRKDALLEVLPLPIIEKAATEDGTYLAILADGTSIPFASIVDYREEEQAIILEIREDQEPLPSVLADLLDTGRLQVPVQEISFLRSATGEPWIDVALSAFYSTNPAIPVLTIHAMDSLQSTYQADGQATFCLRPQKILSPEPIGRSKNGALPPFTKLALADIAILLELSLQDESGISQLPDFPKRETYA